METTTDISRLVSDLEGLTLKPTSKSFLPSLQQLYRLGLVLFRIIQQKRKNRTSIDSDLVVTAYRELIESIPDSSLQSLFADLRKAAQRLCKDRANAKDLALAVQSIEGLIGAFSDSDSQSCRQTESNSRLCRVVYESAWISTLSALYDRFIVLEKQQQSQHKANDTITSTEMAYTKDSVLSCLSRLVLDGLVLAGESTVEESLLDAIRSMEEESTDCLRDLQNWQSREEPFRRNLEDSIQAIGNHGDNDEDETLEKAQQREYIISMLESARGEPSSMAVPAMRSETKTNSQENAKKPPPPKKETELDRRIGQVLHILPHFGEGFVEVALGLHQGDVESTVATLLNHPMDESPPISGYPTALRVLDPKLPRRKREFQAYQTAAEEAHSAEEARRDVKERIALEEKQKQDQYEALMVVTASQQQQQLQEQQEAAKATAAPLPDKKLTRKELRQQKLRQQRKRDEYDDDYDDQYDEIDIKLGAADDGFTSDMTFEQVKLYNQVVQEDESDTAFWESNRNTNQKGSKNNKSSGEKKWGPDKIKGGRVIGADGKIVRKPGGVKKKKNNNNNNNNNNNRNNTSNNGGQNNNNNNNKSSGGNPKGNNNSNNNNNNSSNNSGNKKKPKTKPRSDNRVNRQRDRKMKKQGAFGVQG